MIYLFHSTKWCGHGTQSFEAPHLGAVTFHHSALDVCCFSIFVCGFIRDPASYSSLWFPKFAWKPGLVGESVNILPVNFFSTKVWSGPKVVSRSYGASSNQEMHWNFPDSKPTTCCSLTRAAKVGIFNSSLEISKSRNTSASLKLKIYNLFVTH